MCIVNKLLLFLCSPDANRCELVQCGAVPIFIRLLDSRDIDVQFYSSAALSNLAVHGNGLCTCILNKLILNSVQPFKCFLVNITCNVLVLGMHNVHVHTCTV